MPIKQKLIVIVIIYLSIVISVLLGLYTPYFIGAIIFLAPALYYLYLIYPKFDLSKDIVLNKKEKLVALSFDDGPTMGFTDEILKILKAKKVPATFFVIGKKAQSHKELIKQEISEGHEIGAHTFEHVKLHFKNKAVIDSEISRTRAVLESIYTDLGLSGKMAKIFRAPHGFKNLTLKRYLKKHGLKLIPWTRGVWDTAAPGSQWIIDKSTCNPAANEILLLHDGLGMEESVSHEQKQGILQALPKIIDIYQSKGYRFIKVTELLK